MPRETTNVIAKQPGYLLWAEFQVLSTAQGAAFFLFLFDSIWKWAEQSPDPASTMHLIGVPRKILPGDTLVVTGQVENGEVWMPPDWATRVALADRRQPFEAIQQYDIRPIDNGLSFVLSTSDANIAPPGVDYLNVVARYRNETR